MKLLTASRTEALARGNAMHHHGFHEIVCYTSGRGKLILVDGKEDIGSGRVFLIPPGLSHGEETRNGYGSIWIQWEGMTGLPPGLVMVDDPAHGPVRRLCEMLCHEFRFDPSAPVCRELLSMVLGYLRRLSSKPQADTRVEALKHVLIENIPNPDFRLKKGMGPLGVSPSALHGAFKKALGMSPHQFLLDLRVRESRRLLSVPGMTLAEVSGQVGFRDPFHFSRAFKQKMGISPTAWRLDAKPNGG